MITRLAFGIVFFIGLLLLGLLFAVSLGIIKNDSLRRATYLMICSYGLSVTSSLYWFLWR
jgi:hypothetical protein